MNTITVYYDKECYLCQQYSRYVELRKRHDIRVINAREAVATMKQFKQKGFDIEKGMIIEVNGELFQGSEAMIVLNRYTKKEKWFDRVINQIVQLPFFGRWIFPIMKGMRWITIKLARVGKIIP